MSVCNPSAISPPNTSQPAYRRVGTHRKRLALQQRKYHLHVEPSVTSRLLFRRTRVSRGPPPVAGSGGPREGNPITTLGSKFSGTARCIIYGECVTKDGREESAFLLAAPRRPTKAEGVEAANALR
jgi:hypothetical protein